MVKQIAKNVVEGLRHQPLALALVVVNLAFLIGFTLMFREISDSVERKDALVVEMLKQCVAPK
jgi:hypothetical protein